MRRILNTKLGIIALVLAIAVLVTGVTWAATGAGPSSQTFPEGNAPQIIVTPLTVEVGGSFEVLGAGFKPGSFVLFELVGGAGVGNLLLAARPRNSTGEVSQV